LNLLFAGGRMVGSPLESPELLGVQPRKQKLSNPPLYGIELSKHLPHTYRKNLGFCQHIYSERTTAY
jgi:hypothetical protein